MFVSYEELKRQNENLIIENSELKGKLNSSNFAVVNLTTTANMLENKNKLLARKSANHLIFERKLSEKIDFYKELSVKNSYDKGFSKAFEIMRKFFDENIICEGE